MKNSHLVLLITIIITALYVFVIEPSHREICRVALHSCQEYPSIWNLPAYIEEHDKLFTAASTIVIAFFTFALFFATDGLKASTAESVSIARRSFERFERPYLFLKIKEVRAEYNLSTVRKEDELVHSTSLSLEYFVENVGRTPTIIEGISITAMYADLLPLKFHYPIFESRLVGTPVGAGQLSLVMDFSEDIAIPNSEIVNNKVQLTKKLWLLGRVEYSDMTGTMKYEHRFLYGYDRRDKVFKRHIDPVFTKST